ncbi:MAG: DUF1800 domain-containing protein [SAR202 cluster bacterium]|nr:DUF1800 domain-containing protein [SAR202 cluster bacterium]
MADKNVALMAHLMRRAGFGGTIEEIEARAKKGYEATVEELLDPEAHGIPPIDEAVMYRHEPCFEIGGGVPYNSQSHWMYRLINTPRPLEEKMVLFWHHVFATGASKLDHCVQMLAQMALFRKFGLSNYKTLLTEVSKNPAMIFWLDNNQNHKDAPNENWGRELLELFSMGQGNYTEKDVKEASRAFTGWTIAPSFPRNPYARFVWEFEYRPEDHDDGEKTFLGHKGRFNGDDIIDIICKQPATARFVARHMYNFFVADEVQVPSWLDIPPKDSVAINILASTLLESNWDIKQALRVLFNSDFFKDEKAWYAKVKSPIELVTSTMRLVGDYRNPKPDVMSIAVEPGYMGQSLLDPPSVEGWHTGQEWIDSGSLVRRINFVADRLGDTSLPGVRTIIDRLATKDTLTPEELLESCLYLLGIVRLEEGTRSELIQHLKAGGPIKRGKTEKEREAFATRVKEVLQLIAAAREYQFG